MLHATRALGPSSRNGRLYVHVSSKWFRFDVFTVITASLDDWKCHELHLGSPILHLVPEGGICHHPTIESSIYMRRVSVQKATCLRLRSHSLSEMSPARLGSTMSIDINRHCFHPVTHSTNGETENRPLEDPGGTHPISSTNIHGPFYARFGQGWIGLEPPNKCPAEQEIQKRTQKANYESPPKCPKNRVLQMNSLCLGACFQGFDRLIKRKIRPSWQKTTQVRTLSRSAVCFALCG